jgi:hypothetical protein
LDKQLRIIINDILAKNNIWIQTTSQIRKNTAIFILEQVQIRKYVLSYLTAAFALFYQCLSAENKIIVKINILGLSHKLEQWSNCILDDCNEVTTEIIVLSNKSNSIDTKSYL